MELWWGLGWSPVTELHLNNDTCIIADSCHHFDGSNVIGYMI